MRDALELDHYDSLSRIIKCHNQRVTTRGE